MKYGIFQIIFLGICILITIIHLIRISISNNTRKSKSKQMIKNSVTMLVTLVAFIFTISNLFFSQHSQNFIGNNSLSTQLSIGIFSLCIFILSIISNTKNWIHGLVIIAFIWAIFLKILGSNQLFLMLKEARLKNLNIPKIPITSGILKIISGLILLISGVISS
jgi:hypothetical protein